MFSIGGANAKFKPNRKRIVSNNGVLLLLHHINPKFNPKRKSIISNGKMCVKYDINYS